MNTYSNEVRAHTALHVIKGSLQKVLGTKLTYSTYVKDNHGRITVLANVKPREEEIEEVMREANGVIEKGLPVLKEILPRDDAERIYGKDVYDYFPVPSEVRELIVIKIPNWNVNACSRDHTANTREVGQVLLDYWRYRQAKGLLEVAFNLARSE